jgi:eukaryotic-like serine/threonine-protein kinase
VTKERWARITDIFHTALEKPASERTPFLDEACGKDEALRHDVERLLAGEAEPTLVSPFPEFLASSPVELASGDMLAHYRVEAKLGEGGMGVVYRAYDTRLYRQVALKVLPPDAVADPNHVQRLMQEARAASALNHPNIVTIYEIGSDRDVDFIAMELIAGQTLVRLIGRKLPLRDALKHAVRLASALAAAHRAGIVHRDLKPANIMVNDAGEVKVLDFGLAKRTDQAVADAGSTHTIGPETLPGTILGTVAYMSPEQAEGKKLDARSDIFSFGVVLYEMVTGKQAFERQSIAAMLSAILLEDPKLPSELGVVVPPDLEKILARCLRKEPTRRFQHMDDVEVALKELEEASNSGALERSLAKPKRFRKLAWTAGLLLLAAALAGVATVRLIAPVPEPAIVPVPLTSYPGIEQAPSFSPEGTQVAFQWCREGQVCQIYVKQIGVEPPFRLTDSPAPSNSPAWSPDGRAIAFTRQLSADRLALILVPQRGGREQVLAQFNVGPDYAAYRNHLGWRLLLAWTPDSKYLVAPVWEPEPGTSSRPRGALFLFSAETGEKRRLTTPPNDGWEDTTPAFSPDGRTLAFSRGSEDRYDLYLLRLAEGYIPNAAPELLASDNLLNWDAAWTPDGREIVFRSGTSWERYSLWRMAAAASAKPRRLTYAPELASQPAISRQGNHLTYAVRRTDSNIWRIDLVGPNGKPGSPVKLIASTKRDFNPAYSPDGTRIAFVSDQSGTSEIWVSGSDGSNASQMTSFGGAGMHGPQWSPLGDNIAFQAWPGGNNDIYVISANGGSPRRLTTNPEVDKWPSWSGDGKWLYFVSTRTTGIWKIPAAGGVALPVGGTSEDQPQESPDRKWLYFKRGYPGPYSLWRMPVEGGESAKVLDGMSYNWTLGKDGIYFMTMPDKQGRSNICFQDYATGKVRTISTTDRPVWLGMAVSPDGRSLLYTQLDDTGSDLMLVDNFR